MGLESDPDLRASCDELLQHRWLRERRVRVPEKRIAIEARDSMASLYLLKVGQVIDNDSLKTFLLILFEETTHLSTLMTQLESKTHDRLISLN